jgi:hypothetical protein
MWLLVANLPLSVVSLQSVKLSGTNISLFVSWKEVGKERGGERREGVEFAPQPQFLL